MTNHVGNDAAHDEDRRRSRGMLLWVAATVLSIGSAYFLWKIYGRQLVGAPGEILLTLTRPEAVDLPYPVDDLGPQWGLLMLGELPQRYGRMIALLLGWWGGAALLLGIASRRLRRTGLVLPGRFLLSTAGLAVYGAGVFLLQASLRSTVIYERLAGVDSLDPFVAAQELPLHLATRASFLLLAASLGLAAVVGVGFGKTKSGKALVYRPPRSRVLGFGWVTVLAFSALACFLVYAVQIWFGPIPQLLAHRAGELTEAEMVEGLNGIFSGLRWSGIAVQLAGLLWVVAAWLAPGTPKKL